MENSSPINTDSDIVNKIVKAYSILSKTPLDKLEVRKYGGKHDGDNNLIYALYNADKTFWGFGPDIEINGILSVSYHRFAISPDEIQIATHADFSNLVTLKDIENVIKGKWKEFELLYN